MSKNLGAFISIALLVPIGLARAGEQPIFHSTAVNSEIHSLRAAAVKGDVDAAMRLWVFFKVDQEDPQEAMFWLRVAAENEACGAQYQLAAELYRAKQDASVEYWLSQLEREECSKVPLIKQRTSEMRIELTLRRQKAEKPGK